MQFPSQRIKDWCNNIQALIDAPRVNKTSKGNGFCGCEFEQAILYAPRNQQAQLTSGLFWSVWIDQVMYYVFVDGGIVNFPQEIELYEKFRSIYCFPKLYVCSGRGYLSPHILFDNNYRYLKPDRELLEEDKKEFWNDEVKKWLTNIHRGDVIVALVSAFKEDITKRFENNYGFLSENL